MKLTSIKFLNFRKFRQETLNFTENFNTIFGLNGAGKTSITDAIGYALFGNSSIDFKRGKNSDDMISYFALSLDGKADNPSKIELNFEIDGESFRVVRVIEKGLKKYENDFILEKVDSLFGPNLELSGPGEVTAHIEKNLLGVDRKTFLRSVFAKQKDILVLSGNKSERKELIDSILGIDIIEDLVNIVGDELKDKKRELKIKKGDLINFSLEEVEESKKILTLQKKELEKSFKNVDIELKKQAKSVEVLKEEYKILSNKKDLSVASSNNINLIKQKQEKLISDREETNKKLLTLREKEKYFLENISVFDTEKTILESFSQSQKIQILFDRKIILEREINFTKEKLENIKKIFLEFTGKDFEKQEKENETQLKNLQFKINDLSQKLGIFSSDLIKLKNEADEIKLEKDKISSLGESANCPTCKRKLESQYSFLINSFEKLLEEKRNKWKDISEEKKKIESILSSKKDEIISLEKEILNFKQNKEKFTKLESEKSKFEENLAKLEKEFIEFKDINFDKEAFEKVKKELDEIKIKSNELKKLEGEIIQIKEMQEKLFNFIILEKDYKENLEKEELVFKNIDFKQEGYDETKKKYEDFYGIYTKKQEEFNSLNKSIFELEKQIQVFDNQIDIYNKTVKSCEKLVEDSAYLEVKKQVLKDYSTYLFSYLKPRVEDIASEYFTTMTDFKYSTITIDDDYNIKIDSRILDLYSGGEQDLANLCLRLSLGQNISLINTKNHINFLILDEVLGSQDSTRQNNILIGLKKLEQKFSQIILISHLENVKDFSTKLIEVKALDKDESEIIEY